MAGSKDGGGVDTLQLIPHRCARFEASTPNGWSDKNAEESYEREYTREKYKKSIKNSHFTGIPRSSRELKLAPISVGVLLMSFPHVSAVN
jgi:hypothetical protein